MIIHAVSILAGRKQDLPVFAIAPVLPLRNTLPELHLVLLILPGTGHSALQSTAEGRLFEGIDRRNTA